MKKLLILTDWFAPGYRAGGPIRSVVNLASTLADDFEVWVLTSDRDFKSPARYDHIEVDKWVTFHEKIKAHYLSPGRQKISILKKLIREISPDVIYLNSMFSRVFTIYPLHLLWQKKISARVIIAPRGMLHTGAVQYKAGKKKLFLLLLKMSGLVKRLYFQATDHQEYLDILRRVKAQPSQIRILENIPAPPPKEIAYIEKRKGSAKLIFLSRVSPKKNLLFLLEQVSSLSRNSRIQLTIAGPVEDPGYFEKCKRIIQKFPSHISVQYYGAVPHHQVAALLQQHHFFILPTYGENFGHVIFEALGNARPVIISDQTPWRNLQEKGIGWDIPLKNTSSFKQVIAKAINLDQSSYSQMAQCAWTYANNYLKNSNLTKRYVDFFSNHFS